MQPAAPTIDAKTLGPRLATGGTAEIFALDAGRVLKLYWGGAAPVALPASAFLPAARRWMEAGR